MTLVETTGDVVRLSCLRALLTSAGIRVEGRDSPDGFSGTVSRHEIVVSDHDAARARALIADFDRLPSAAAPDEG